MNTADSSELSCNDTYDLSEGNEGSQSLESQIDIESECLNDSQLAAGEYCTDQPCELLPSKLLEYEYSSELFCSDEIDEPTPEDAYASEVFETENVDDDPIPLESQKHDLEPHLSEYVSC